MRKKNTRFGDELLASVKEALAHKKGKIVLPAREVEDMTPARIKAIRKSVAKTPVEFCQRFGVPARTIEGWEQGKKVDVAGRVLLKVIERNPDAVQEALEAV